jgi:predicted transcriptional regulator
MVYCDAMKRMKGWVKGGLAGEPQRIVVATRTNERGEKFYERRLVCEEWEALARVLTGRRMALLGFVRRHEVASIRALAKALKRDYRNVHGDVKALKGVGLVEVSAQGVMADYDAIETRIAI